MAFNHRKLISGSEKIGMYPCDISCDTRNTEGYCPTPCMYVCPLICIHPFSFPPLPPPPPPLPPPPPPPTSIQNKILSLPLPLLTSISVLLALCFLLFCYFLYKSYKKWDELRKRRSHEVQQEEIHDQFFDEDHGPVVDHPIWYIRTVGLQSSVINSIAVCKYKRGDGLVEGTECSVCLNEFKEDETLRLLPKCNHAFHTPCIDTWLRSHTNCPLCRAGIEARTPMVTEEQSVGNLGIREDNQVVVPEGGSELSWDREDRESELIGSEEEGEREGESVEKILEIREEVVVHQPKRRSVSMDCLSTSMTSLAIANACQGEIAGNSDSQMRKTKESSFDIVSNKVDVDCSLLKLVGGSSLGRSLTKGPI